MILFSNETTNTTSPEFRSRQRDQKLLIYGTWGGATVTLQIKSSTGVWIPVTDASYTEDTAVEIGGYGDNTEVVYRLEITGGAGASITAEII